MKKLYDVIIHSDKDEFIKIVQSRIDLGWKLEGGISTTTIDPKYVEISNKGLGHLMLSQAISYDNDSQEVICRYFIPPSV